jgi:D-tyrosyl-tRNA(Tyr) deacylase
VRVVVQRVTSGSVSVEGAVAGSIGLGLLVLLGVTHDDTDDDVRYIADKIVSMRIFSDSEGRANLSLADIGGALLVVSQFTLYADTRRGRRPSFVAAAGGDKALAVYEDFVTYARSIVEIVEKGVFGAMMEVRLVNDGPFTILIDSKTR